jgi:hypothetical protein
MAKRLFDDEDRYGGDAGVRAIVDEADAVVREFMNKHIAKGYSVRDLQLVLAGAASDHASYSVLVQQNNKTRKNSAYLHDAQAVWTGQYYRGKCSCGWVSEKQWLAEPDAAADAKTHMDQQRSGRK